MPGRDRVSPGRGRGGCSRAAQGPGEGARGAGPGRCQSRGESLAITSCQRDPISAAAM